MQHVFSYFYISLKLLHLLFSIIISRRVNAVYYSNSIYYITLYNFILFYYFTFDYDQSKYKNYVIKAHLEHFSGRKTIQQLTLSLQSQCFAPSFFWWKSSWKILLLLHVAISNHAEIAMIYSSLLLELFGHSSILC